MLSAALAGRLEPAGADVVRRRTGSVFFLERKNQEIFAHQVPERQATPHLNGQKSFCFFFFRKRRVLCFLPEAVNGCEVYDSLQLRPLLLCPARQAGGGQDWWRDATMERDRCRSTLHCGRRDRTGDRSARWREDAAERSVIPASESGARSRVMAALCCVYVHRDDANAASYAGRGMLMVAGAADRACYCCSSRVNVPA